MWNSKMREEVLEQMEAARENPESAGTPQDFHFKALQVGSTNATCCLCRVPAVNLLLLMNLASP